MCWLVLRFHWTWFFHFLEILHWGAPVYLKMITSTDCAEILCVGSFWNFIRGVFHSFWKFWIWGPLWGFCVPENGYFRRLCWNFVCRLGLLIQSIRTSPFLEIMHLGAESGPYLKMLITPIRLKFCVEVGIVNWRHTHFTVFGNFAFGFVYVKILNFTDSAEIFNGCCFEFALEKKLKRLWKFAFGCRWGAYV